MQPMATQHCKYKLPGKNYLILKLRESTDHVYNIELANMC